MLGKKISDPHAVEAGGSMTGMELLPLMTELQEEKTRTQVTGSFGTLTGPLSVLSGQKISGYEIHMGSTERVDAEPDTAYNRLCSIRDERTKQEKTDGAICGNVYGSYVHGIFDEGEIAKTVVGILAEKKGVLLDTSTMMDYSQFKEQQYDKLADGLRKSMDMEAVYAMLREAAF